MDKLSLVLALVALIVGGTGYWRSGGKQDVAYARQEIEEEVQVLRAKQRELVENVSAATTAAYKQGRTSMKRAGERLAELRKEAGESLQRQIDTASAQIDKLQQRVTNGMEAMKDTTIAAARDAQVAVTKRIHRMEARVDILRAKRKINDALERADEAKFEKAEQRLEEAVALIKDARQTLGDDHAYESKLDTVAESLREAVVAVKAKAEDVKARIEQVVAESDTLISALEADEQASEAAAK